MATIEVIILPWENAYKRGFEDAFMMMSNFENMDETLNCNNIDTHNDEDNSDI